MMNRAGIEWKNWSAATRVRLGNVLVDCVLSSCNWFYVFKQRIGRKTTLHLMPTAEFLDIKDQILQQAELYSAGHGLCSFLPVIGRKMDQVATC